MHTSASAAMLKFHMQMNIMGFTESYMKTILGVAILLIFKLIVIVKQVFSLMQFIRAS